MKKLNLGNSDFKNIITNNNYYLDKSLFIEEVINSPKQISLLPRPRRFGKTLNLSMLKYFFDINEPDNKKLFTKLKIWQTGDYVKQHLGKYPVIYLTFKDAKAETWTNTLNFIKTEIIQLYSNNDYVLKDNLLKEHEKNKFKKILNETAEETDFADSIKLLSKYLHRYYKEKVIILVDEYDTPIQAGYKKFYDKAIAFMRSLLSGAFKDNSSLHKGVITGILRISRESIFTGLNNLGIYSILKNRFSDCFGFTEKEVKQILIDFKINTDYAEIKKWYDGYKFGNTSNIYNPWSLLCYIADYEDGFDTFWANSSYNKLVKERIIERDYDYIKMNIEKLVRDIPIEKIIDENIVFTDFDNHHKELLWSLLLFSGYLNAEKTETEDFYKLSIPNYEIKKIFKKIIMQWLVENLKISNSLIYSASQNLINNKITEFESDFRKIIGDTLSYFDIAQKTVGKEEQKVTLPPENVFHSYMLGLLAIIGDKYIIRSNRESGKGRYDILLRPFDKKRNGIVIEIKAIAHDATSSEINNAIIKAKKQIEEKDYCKELIDNKIENIIKLPIVFVGKKPYIKILNN